jgi:YfiH family protein
MRRCPKILSPWLSSCGWIAKSIPLTDLFRDYVLPHWCLPEGIAACVTTVSSPGNVAAHVGHDPSAVIRHRRQLSRELQLPAPVKWLKQYHSTAVVDYQHAVVGQPADAIIAAQRNSVCAVLTADCLPILLAADDGSEIAAVHAGWRGLAQGIVEQTLAKLRTPAQQLTAYIGPAISADYFEVGADVRAAFNRDHLLDEQTFRPHIANKWYADLPELARRIMSAYGVREVTLSGLCTFSDKRFSSYRQHSDCGRIATLIWKY